MHGRGLALTEPHRRTSAPVILSSAHPMPTAVRHLNLRVSTTPALGRASPNRVLFLPRDGAANDAEKPVKSLVCNQKVRK
jgi:hypothetical protein